LSFSSQVRNEIARIYPDKRCCRKAELSAILVTEGLIQPENNEGGYWVDIAVNNAAVARKVYRMLKEDYSLYATVDSQYHRTFRPKRVYRITVFLTPNQLSLMQGIVALDKHDRIKPQVNWRILRKTCCKRAYLRGIFLNRGFINQPEGSYHLEIVLNDGQMVSDVTRLLNRLNLKSGWVERKRNQVIYIKESEKIADLLRIIEANKALLDFENIRIIKSMRNTINRQVNCETANLAKTVDASVRQVETIRTLRSLNLWEELSPELKELAELRLNYPDYSLKELGMVLNPPLSKSGVAYRMGKLERLAKSFTK
jgi:DNA-binding protein WhiA